MLQVFVTDQPNIHVSSYHGMGVMHHDILVPKRRDISDSVWCNNCNESKFRK